MAETIQKEESPFSPFQRAVEQGIVGTGEIVQAETGEKVMGRRPDSAGDWAPAFLGALMQGSTVLSAANIAGVHASMTYFRRKRDELFRRAWNEAADIGTRLMEQEAARRAYHGTIKPVFHNGKKCGEVREYSDLLLIFLLKARKPEMYRDSAASGGVNISVQTNIAAVELLRKIVQDDRVGSSEQTAALALSDALSNGGHQSALETGEAPGEDEHRTGEGVADT